MFVCPHIPFIIDYKTINSTLNKASKLSNNATCADNTATAGFVSDKAFVASALISGLYVVTHALLLPNASVVMIVLLR